MCDVYLPDQVPGQRICFPFRAILSAPQALKRDSLWLPLHHPEATTSLSWTRMASGPPWAQAQQPNPSPPAAAAVDTQGGWSGPAAALRGYLLPLCHDPQPQRSATLTSHRSPGQRRWREGKQRAPAFLSWGGAEAGFAHRQPGPRSHVLTSV